MLYSLPRVIAFKLNRGPFQSGKKHKKESSVTKKIGHELNSEEIKAQTFAVDKKKKKILPSWNTQRTKISTEKRTNENKNLGCIFLQQ